MFIVMEQNDILDRLNEILDAKNNITYRTVALEILENLCSHCTLDKDYVKEALLPNVSLQIHSSSNYIKKIAGTTIVLVILF
uniref:Condensin complex subunit 1 C-terminal domain-containing protein n=1 Tax=Aegilops tauschii subsp. strangulata TaxID=200361 RepID=A0A453IQW2_AEGTS